MNRQLGVYGKIVIGVIVAVFIFASFAVMGQKAREKEVTVPDNSGNIESDLMTLVESGYYPYFEGVCNFTIKKNYKGKDGITGLSREDALDGIKGYEYVMENGTPTVKEVSADKIKVYPYDEESGAEQQSSLTEPDVSTTGRYVIKYAIEGESGLNAEQSVIVLVDYLPDGVERQNEKASGGE